MGIYFFSAILLLGVIVSIFVFEKTNHFKINKLIFSIFIFLESLYILGYILINYFSESGFDTAVMYHLRYGLGGAGFSEYWKLIVISIFYILGSIFVAYKIYLIKDKQKTERKFYTFLAYIFIGLITLANPLTADFYNYYKVLNPPANSADFNEYYNEPILEKISEDNKNLVVIYAEGLERTYFDEEIFPGLIKDLRDLEDKSTFFSQIKTYDGFNSTMGGIVAGHCGIPLFNPSGGNDMTGLKEFLPSVSCVGDLLHEEDYHLTYYGGADLAFAGKGKFYATHKFDEIYGGNELIPKLKEGDITNEWGLYDDTLFDMAYERFLDLSEEEEEQALFLLTFDTHHPNGHPSPSCAGIKYGNGKNPMLNAVACADYLISKFVNKVIDSEYSDNTVIVVVSDHLGKKNTATELLDQKERNNLFMIIDPTKDGLGRIDKLGSSLDVGTTILPFLGYKANIGLGRNLLDSNQSDEEIATIHDNLAYWKSPISKFWDSPSIKEYLEIDEKNKYMSIDGRLFPIPALIELDKNLQTNIKHETKSKLFDEALTMNKDSFFLLIDEFSEGDYSLVAGVGGKAFDRYEIDGKKRFSIDEVTRMLNINLDFDIDLGKDFVAERVVSFGEESKGKAIDRLNENYEKGFLYFDIDFSLKEDGDLICLDGLEGCKLDVLVDWIGNNPLATVVTSVENDDNMEILEILSEKIPDYKTRIIPQIYYPQDYNRVKDMGYQQIIWNLDKYISTNNHVLWWINTFDGAFAIAMPEKRIETSFLNSLSNNNIPFYFYTINNEEELKDILNVYGASEIYTNFLKP